METVPRRRDARTARQAPTIGDGRVTHRSYLPTFLPGPGARPGDPGVVVPATAGGHAGWVGGSGGV